MQKKSNPNSLIFTRKMDYKLRIHYFPAD